MPRLDLTPSTRHDRANVTNGDDNDNNDNDHNDDDDLRGVGGWRGMTTKTTNHKRGSNPPECWGADDDPALTFPQGEARGGHYRAAVPRDRDDRRGEKRQS